jgi:SAM-dependent methyltransferase
MEVYPRAKAEVESVLCAVCGPAPTRVWLDEGRSTRYVRCGECGTVYASPRLTRAARDRWLNETFGVGANAFDNARRRRRTLALEAAIVHRHVRRGRLLDVGCDTGAFFEGFPDPEWQRFGVELSASAASYAARTYKAKVFAGRARELQLSTAFFDVVTMIDMLYYAEDPRAELSEALRVLKPGGLLVIEFAGQAWSLQRGRGLASLLIDGRWSRLHSDSSYLYWFTPEALETLLMRSGFDVIARHVIPGPSTSRAWRRGLVTAYTAAVGLANRLSARSLTLAPKYLLLARARR